MGYISKFEYDKEMAEKTILPLLFKREENRALMQLQNDAMMLPRIRPTRSHSVDLQAPKYLTKKPVRTSNISRIGTPYISPWSKTEDVLDEDFDFEPSLGADNEDG
jgi:hypothetical protein